MKTQTLYNVVRSGRLYEQSVAQIETRIHTGAFHVGDQLPLECDRAEQFGVSRTAVREMLDPKIAALALERKTCSFPFSLIQLLTCRACNAMREHLYLARADSVAAESFAG